MWVLIKIVSRILFPVPSCLEVLLVGLLLLWVTRRQKMGKTLVALGAVLLFPFNSQPVSSLLLGPLDEGYPPLSISPGALVADRSLALKVIFRLAASIQAANERRTAPSPHGGAESTTRSAVGRQ
jgi:hypothetical protein